jgi:hypothetical protein
MQPGDIVTVQGERVSRFFVVISGSIGTLNHAAAEGWHRKTQGPLAQMKMLSPALRDAVSSSEYLAPALLDIDAHPMSFAKCVRPFARRDVVTSCAGTCSARRCCAY